MILELTLRKRKKNKLTLAAKRTAQYDFRADFEKKEKKVSSRSLPNALCNMILELTLRKRKKK